MTTILVTGGTRGLGVPTVEGLRAAGHDVRVLSRGSSGTHQGDLSTGAGVDGGTRRSPRGRAPGDESQEGHRLRPSCCYARRSAPGAEHLVFISIVGVDRDPFPYFKDKLASERAIEDSGVPYTILRATQFHSFIAMFFRFRLPVILAPGSARAADRHGGGGRSPGGARAGRPLPAALPDIGGPQIRTQCARWRRSGKRAHRVAQTDQRRFASPARR